jgi:cation diffusion facilitator family transporter
MSDCDCRDVQVSDEGGRRTLILALCLNAMMFVVGLIAGLAGQSSGLIADSLDMLADASAYAIGLLAFGRSALFKARAATLSGSILLVLGAGVVIDAARRGFYGSTPHSLLMIGIASVSLVVNSTVFYLLGKQKNRNEVHVRASYIFTRADVVANIGVILSGLILLTTGFRYVDLISGGAIGIYVIREAVEILREARTARRMALRHTDVKSLDVEG